MATQIDAARRHLRHHALFPAGAFYCPLLEKAQVSLFVKFYAPVRPSLRVVNVSLTPFFGRSVVESCGCAGALVVARW
jgi:hypothetical protein